MTKSTNNILAVIAFAVIISPIAASVLERKEAPATAPAPVVRRPEPKPVKAPTDPAAWFAGIRSRCTPADVTLATDLNRPPDGVDGTGYEAACFALAQNTPKARAILLGLPENDRLRGATLLYEVADGLAARGRHDAAGPLMELVLEFWPNHYLALYEAGRARYTSGDLAGAQGFLARFLQEYRSDDQMVANANRMMGAMAER